MKNENVDCVFLQLNLQSLRTCGASLVSLLHIELYDQHHRRGQSVKLCVNI